MKYLWLIFLVCTIGLILQVRFGETPDNPFADGRLASMPMPPAVPRVEPPLLPAPIIERIPPPAAPVPVVATSIEIFNPVASSGLMVETRHADNADWGLPRGIPGDSPAPLAYIPEARVVQPVPVNTPTPTPVPAPPLPDTNLADTTPLWGREIQNWNAEDRILAYANNPAMPSLSPVPTADINPAAPVDPAAASPTPAATLYPVPEAPPIETASLDPKRLVSSSAVKAPNLYLPDGATDEEGARLTLIRNDLRVYELPDEQSAPAPIPLKEGDQVRPLTRLRNASGYDWIKIEIEDKSWWAQAEYFIRVDPRNRRKAGTDNLEYGKEQVDKDSALPADYHPTDLTDLAGKYTFGAKNISLRKEAADALEEMAREAEKEGLQIRVFSGFRDFAYQKKLYLDAVQKEGPKQDGTAAPGYSEHQLGTTADICNEDRRTILNNTFSDTREGRWLTANSEKFGFRKSYTVENTAQVGYKPEAWHFRYIGKPDLKAAPERTVAEKP